MANGKKETVRMLSFAIACLFMTAGAFSALNAAIQTREAALYDADRKLLLHIAEEADNAARLATRISESEVPSQTDLLALCRTCSAVTTSATLHSNTEYSTGTAQLYASVEARAEHALASGDSTDVIPPWLTSCLNEAASLLSDTAVLLMASEGTALPKDVLPMLDELSSLCSAFAPDPLKVFIASETHPSYRFDAERVHTKKEAWEDLAFALEARADLFLSLDAPTEKEAQKNDAKFVFSCKNGFAELSARGGHLLRYALYPTQGTGSTSAAKPLSEPDLIEIRDAFLSRNGMPVRMLILLSEKEEHGLHYYTFARKGDSAPCLTIGLRATDGGVFYFDGEAFYYR